MYATSFKKNVYPLLFIFFSDLEECYALHIHYINEIKTKSTSKSVPILLCREKGFKINVKKLQKNYRYDIEEFLERFINRHK